MTRGAEFPPTRWSVVRRASEAVSARAALGDLCEAYWYPLYAFLRRTGTESEAAADLVQEFCAELLEHGGLEGADPARGAFRHYVLGALRHFVQNRRREERAVKRGGKVLHWSMEDAEECYGRLASLADSPQRIFERTWALAVLDRARTRLGNEYRARGRADLFDALGPAIGDAGTTGPQAALAERLGTTTGALKVALHRMRQRLRDLVRDEVAQTLEDPVEVEAELGLLFAALGASSAV